MKNQTIFFPNPVYINEIPDPEALYTVNDVPHGRVSYCTYNSSVLNLNRPLLVYTPADYAERTGGIAFDVSA